MGSWKTSEEREERTLIKFKVSYFFGQRAFHVHSSWQVKWAQGKMMVEVWLGKVAPIRKSWLCPWIPHTVLIGAPQAPPPLQSLS